MKPSERPSMPRIKEAARMRNEGMTSKEIAAVMGLSVGCINNYLYEAISMGLCQRMRPEKGKGKYIEVAKVYNEYRLTMTSKAAVYQIASDMGISRRYAYSLIGEARRKGLVPPCRRRMNGTAVDFKKMLTDGAAEWILDNAIDGMSDLEMAAILLNEAYLVSIGIEE